MTDEPKVLEREDTALHEPLWRETSEAQVPAVARGKNLPETLVPDAGQQTLQTLGHVLDGLHLVVQKVDLTAALELA